MLDSDPHVCVASSLPTKPLLQPQNVHKASKAAETSVISPQTLVYRCGQVALSLWLLVGTRESKVSLGNRSDLIIET